MTVTYRLITWIEQYTNVLTGIGSFQGQNTKKRDPKHTRDEKNAFWSDEIEQNLQFVFESPLSQAADNIETD